MTASVRTRWTWCAALLLALHVVDGVLPGPASAWGPADDALLQYGADGVLRRRADDDGACRGTWSCVRRDLAASLADILTLDQYNVTPGLSVERVRYPEREADVDRMATSLNEAGLPTLASTAIKVFETHALVWKLWPGMLHLKVFRDPDEGMDAAAEIPASDGSRTWGLGARRRLTMALLPIMYKMGVGTTLLGVLVFIALKTMFMVSILFVLAISSFAKHKLSALAQHHAAPVYYSPPPPAHHKEVHVHVHADPHKQAYHGWHRYGNHHAPHESYPPVYSTQYHSGPPSDDGYLEQPAYYHQAHRRRAGAAPAVDYAGGLGLAAAPAAPGQLLSRWDLAAAAAPAGYEPDMYSRAHGS